MLQTHAFKKKRERNEFLFYRCECKYVFFFFPLRGPAVQYTTDYPCVRVCVRACVCVCFGGFREGVLQYGSSMSFELVGQEC